MTDQERRETYAKRDELLAGTADATQTTLHILRDVLKAHHDQQVATAAHRERVDLKLDRIEADLANLREHNNRQDRIASNTSAVAEEALTLAEHPRLRDQVRTSGAVWGSIAGGAAIVAAAGIQHLIAPLLTRLWP